MSLPQLMQFGARAGTVAGLITSIVLVLYAQFAFGESLVAKDTTGIYITQDGESEMIANRTRSFKKFRKGRKRRVAGQIGPIHYRTDPFSDTEQYKEIDLTINLTPGESWDAAMESNGYQVRFWQSRVVAGKTVRYIAQFRRAGKWLAMCPLALIWENDAGQKQLISKPVAGIVPVIDNDAYTVTWADCFGSGLNYRYNIRPDEFFKTVIVEDKTDLPTPTIGLSGLKLTVVLGISWDNQLKAANGFAGGVIPDVMPNDTDASSVDEELVDSERFAYQDESFRDTFWMQRPRAWDSAEERHEIDVLWRLRRRGNKIFAALSVPATALNNPAVVYPVFIDTDITEEQVGASADDAARRMVTSAYSRIADDLEIGFLNSSYKRLIIGFRFQTVPLPDDVILDSASITVTSLSGAAGTPVNTRIRCEDIDDAAEMPATAGAFDTKFGNKTTAFVNWDGIGTQPIDTEYTSPDISSPVQEVIDRVGWSSSNDLVIFWDDDDERGTAYRVIYSYDASSTKAAKFNASYTGGGGQVIMIGTE